MTTYNQSSPSAGMALLGQFIGNYRLMRVLGEGGMGVVFEAVHASVGGQVAIKILRPEVASRQDVTSRFFNEARAANSISHPGIVRIFDCGYTQNGIAYLVMEFLAGESLKARLVRSRQLATRTALRISRQIASALQAAHQRGVIHRDLKPDNVLLVPDPDLPGGERAKVVDFGVAKITESLNAEAMRTRSDLLMGTPAYMAPEQCRGAKNVTDKSDVYSLGIILYQMLAGTQPFVGDSIGELIAMHLTDEPPQLLQAAPHVDPQVAGLVHTMLVKKPAVRPNMEEVLRTLLRLEDALSSASTLGLSPDPAGPSVMSSPQQPQPAVKRPSAPALTPLSARPSTQLSVAEQSSAEVAEQPKVAAQSGDERATQPLSLERLRQAAQQEAAAAKSRGSNEQIPTQPISAVQLQKAGQRPSPPQLQPVRFTSSDALTASLPTARRLSSSEYLTAAQFPGSGASITGTASEVRRLFKLRRSTWFGFVGATLAVGLILFGTLWWGRSYSSSTSTVKTNKTSPEGQKSDEKAVTKSAEQGVVGQPVVRPSEPTPTQSSEVISSNKAESAAEAARLKSYNLLKDKQYADAQKWAQKCVSLKPKYAKCWWIIGKTSCRQDQFESINNAIEQLDALGKEDLVQEIVRECEDAGLRLNLQGYFYRPVRFEGPGIPGLRDPFSPRSLRNAIALANSGKCTEATRVAETYLDQNLPDAWVVIGSCACATKNADRANQAIRKLGNEPSKRFRFDLIDFCQRKGFRYSSGQFSPQ